MIKTRTDGLGGHFAGWWVERDKHTESGVFTFYYASEITYITGFHRAGFDLHQHALRCISIVINECDYAVNASIAAFFADLAPLLAAKWFGFDKG